MTRLSGRRLPTKNLEEHNCHDEKTGRGALTGCRQTYCRTRHTNELMPAFALGGGRHTRLLTADVRTCVPYSPILILVSEPTLRLEPHGYFGTDAQRPMTLKPPFSSRVHLIETGQAKVGNVQSGLHPNISLQARPYHRRCTPAQHNTACYHIYDAMNRYKTGRPRQRNSGVGELTAPGPTLHLLHPSHCICGPDTRDSGACLSSHYRVDSRGRKKTLGNGTALVRSLGQLRL